MYDFIFNRQKKRGKIILNESKTVVRHWVERARDIMVGNKKTMECVNPGPKPIGRVIPPPFLPAKVQIIFKSTKYFEKKMKKSARRHLLCLNGENTKNGETINDFAVFIKISRSRYPISICRSTFVRACSVFGSVTVSTPCSTRAAILAFSTSSGKSSVCSNFV